MIIRIIGAVIILLTTVMAGICLSYIAHTRIKRLSAMVSSFYILSGDIRYGATSLPDACMNIAKGSHSDYLKNFYQRLAIDLNKDEFIVFSELWNRLIYTYVKEIYLTENDCEVLCEIGELPLHLDKEMQIKHIENICCRLNDIIAEAKSCVNNKCRIYQCTSIAAGIIIVILLL